jgi:hypothetical protein
VIGEQRSRGTYPLASRSNPMSPDPMSPEMRRMTDDDA